MTSQTSKAWAIEETYIDQKGQKHIHLMGQVELYPANPMHWVGRIAIVGLFSTQAEARAWQKAHRVWGRRSYKTRVVRVEIEIGTIGGKG